MSMCESTIGIDSRYLLDTPRYRPGCVIVSGSIMKKSRVWIIWFVGAVMFFGAAMVSARQSVVYIPVGVVFLVLALNASRQES